MQLILSAAFALLFSLVLADGSATTEANSFQDHIQDCQVNQCKGITDSVKYNDCVAGCLNAAAPNSTSISATNACYASCSKSATSDPKFNAVGCNTDCDKLFTPDYTNQNNSNSSNSSASWAVTPNHCASVPLVVFISAASWLYA